VNKPWVKLFLMYLGQMGTFVMKKWEVVVLPAHVRYEGELVKGEEWNPERRRFWRRYKTFGKLDPWRMGFVAIQPLQEPGSSTTTDLNLCQSGSKFFSAIQNH
jgi:hypothetical protein